MKKNIFAIICMLAVTMVASAKSTYIATYSNNMTLTENGMKDSQYNKLSSLEMTSADGMVTFAIVQQEVDDELIEQIRDCKRAKNLAIVGQIGCAVGEGFAISDMGSRSRRKRSGAFFRYTIARDAEEGMRELENEKKYELQDLMKLGMLMVVTNNSDTEIVVTDTENGKMFFVQPLESRAIEMVPGQECRYRVSASNALAENVKYITATAKNSLEKYTLSAETNQYWYVPMSKKAAEHLHYRGAVVKGGYIRVDKASMDLALANEAEIRDIKF